jgi:hypothetical protein
VPRKTISCAIAAAVSVTAATPVVASAHDYQRYQDACTDRIHDNGVTGALLGGAAGALIGSNVAGHSARTGGALIGAAAGAAVGSNIARSSTKDRCRGGRAVYYREPAPVYYAPPPAPVYYAPPPRPVYYVPPPPPPVYSYDVYEVRHDHGRHRGWYKHRHDGDDDDD